MDIFNKNQTSLPLIGDYTFKESTGSITPKTHRPSSNFSLDQQRSFSDALKKEDFDWNKNDSEMQESSKMVLGCLPRGNALKKMRSTPDTSLFTVDEDQGHRF